MTAPDPSTEARLVAELDAGAAAVASSYLNLAPISRGIVGVVLDAVVPLITARVREQVAEEIAEAIDARRERAKTYHGRAALMRAAEEARARRTSPGARTDRVEVTDG